MTRWALVALGVLAAGVAALAAPASRAVVEAEAVTLSLDQYSNPNKVRTLVFFGDIADGAREYVEVLGRDCGANHERLITGTQSAVGGRWRIENPNANPPWNYTPVYSGTTFRARWNNRYSEPVVWRLPAQPRVTKLRGRRAWRVQMTPATPQGQVSLKGKVVELQRLSRGTWVRVRRARLAYKPRYAQFGGPFNYEVVFAVPTRGLTLRAFVPAASAAPCYAAGASPQWRS